MWDSVLPPEVLRLVFSLLPPRHLKNALLVSSSWREVGEAPRLWQTINLKITKQNLRLMPGVLGARRMLAVREITVEEVEELEELEELLMALSRQHHYLHTLYSRITFSVEIGKRVY